MKHPKTVKNCKHTRLQRFYEYVDNDCYFYTKLCKDCGKKSVGWTKEAAERGDLK
jgi:hypothetical protein